MSSSQVPDEAVVAEIGLRSRRRRPLTSSRVLRGSIPYLLILPVVVVIGAILGYPLYKLVTLSFQQYGLPELIQRQGSWVGFENYESVLRDQIFWDTLLRTVVFTVANVGLTIVLGTLLALLLVRVSTWVRVLLTVGLVLAWSMPAVVAVQVFYWMTNFQNGILNYVLTRAPRRRLLPARLVRDDVLEARDGDALDRLGCDSVRDDHLVCGPRSGSAGARRGGRDRRRRARCACSAT